MGKHPVFISSSLPHSIAFGNHVRKMMFSMKVFVILLDYLKIPQVTILGDLHV
jgi:hypothetical protein